MLGKTGGIKDIIRDHTSVVAVANAKQSSRRFTSVYILVRSGTYIRVTTGIYCTYRT